MEKGQPEVPWLGLARDLARAASFSELVEAVQREVERSIGYESSWLAVKDRDDADFLRIIDVAGANRDTLLQDLPPIPVAGDALLAEIFESNRVVVVEDARVDPRTNKAIVEAVGNRTIVNVPLAIYDTPFGALGMGTFRDEGVRPPSPEMIESAIAIASLVSIAASRIRMVELERVAARKQRAIEARLARMQRLDTVGALAGGVAHDFNNLLTVISASAGLARRAPSLDDARAELRTIEAMVERASALTRQLLAMSRMQPLKLGRVDIHALLETLVPLLRRVLPDDISVDLINPPLGAEVEADRTQLEQVLMNLGINARDAMQGGGRLTIEAELVVVNGEFRENNPWAKPGRYVLITVSDTGHGIEPAHLDRVFDPFFTTKAEGAGTGLGLSVSQGIVAQHGGMIQVYSEVGLGTTFKIYLPVSARLAVRVGPKLPGAVRGGTERILVGEDDPSVRAVVERVLVRAGYQVTLAADGAEVLRQIEQRTYDLMLLDAVMPGAACLETIDRALARQPSLRIVVASGYTADPHVATLLRDRALPLLAKPYDPDTLLRTLRASLDS